MDFCLPNFYYLLCNCLKGVGLEHSMQALSKENQSSWQAFSCAVQKYVHKIVFQEKIKNLIFNAFSMVSRIQIWSEFGGKALPGAEECQDSVGTGEQLSGLWLHGGDDRKRWLVSGLIKGQGKRDDKAKSLITNKLTNKSIKPWMCLAAWECLVLLCMLSSWQSSEERRCYNSLWADVETVLWRCTATPGTEQSRVCVSWLATQPLLTAHQRPRSVGNREAIHLADLGLSPLPWDWSHISCLSFFLGKNPSKQQSVFQL